MNIFEARALDIAQSSTYLTLYARQGQTIQAIEYFAYSVEIDNVAAGATSQGTFQVLSDSDFVCTYLSGMALYPTAGTVDPVPQALLQITDTGSGKTFFNQASFMGLVVGQGGYPFLLPAPRLLAPNTNIQYTVTNLLAAGAANVRNYYITMEGARIFYSGT
jgi:multisubunit Na+/H+ antiporter MnhC subunit